MSLRVNQLNEQPLRRWIMASSARVKQSKEWVLCLCHQSTEVTFHLVSWRVKTITNSILLPPNPLIYSYWKIHSFFIVLWDVVHAGKSCMLLAGKPALASWSLSSLVFDALLLCPWPVKGSLLNSDSACVEGSTQLQIVLAQQCWSLNNISVLFDHIGRGHECIKCEIIAELVVWQLPYIEETYRFWWLIDENRYQNRRNKSLT